MSLGLNFCPCFHEKWISSVSCKNVVCVLSRQRNLLYVDIIHLHMHGEIAEIGGIAEIWSHIPLGHPLYAFAENDPSVTWLVTCRTADLFWNFLLISQIFGKTPFNLEKGGSSKNSFWKNPQNPKENNKSKGVIALTNAPSYVHSDFRIKSIL
jgi:hypothetical protein